jgi:subtilisin family serine protease
MKPSVRLLVAAMLSIAVSQVPGGVSAAPGQSSEQASGRDIGPRRANNRYIVRMADLPVSSYTGGTRTLRATRPARGQKIDRANPAVAEYSAYLDGQHGDVLGRVGGGRRLYDYRYSFNGFTAVLSEPQADALKAQPGVLSVTKDELQHADTSSTPTFLGLDRPGGLWDRLGGADDAGEDIIIGMIDSGVWPESTSFSDRRKSGGGRNEWHDRRRHDGKNDHDDDGDQAFDHDPPWTGVCQTGEAFTARACNRKLIGARWFDAAWGGDAGLKAERPWEFASPRDYNGHGTHTASTAGGNRGVVATGPARIFGKISGMAPRARIAVYKALWSTQDGAEASGFTSDLVAAIDQAVADGVDVINYSISGSSTNFLDAAEISFLFAADAGVFVAASAGNDGPTASTVAHPSPWITTVAAGTHNRQTLGSAKLGNGTTVNGVSVAATAASGPVINATAAVMAGATATAARLCFTAADNGGTPALDPAKVAGKVVVCERGTNARVAKSQAVFDAGGVGMILVNTSPNSLNADFHAVPTVHLADTDRVAVEAYAAMAGATATVTKATITYDAPAPFTASFSSRGPLLAGNGDLLKPDVIAPGQDILASVAPPGNGGLDFNVYSGTSMSSPHVAGVAALLRQLHPDWTPMMIKSALMTSAYDVLDGANTSPAVIFSQGAGHIAPNPAASPGLVYDSNINDWFAFLCGATNGVNPALCTALSEAGYSLDPSDLNTPSIAIGDLTGLQTVTRTVTNVGRRHAVYHVRTTGMDGFKVVVKPSTLRLAPGTSQSFSVQLTRQTAAVNTYAGGQLTWSDGEDHVRIPMVVRPTALAAPAEVSSTGTPVDYSVTFGFNGPFATVAHGLIPAVTTTGVVPDDPGDSFSPGGPGTIAIPVTISPGTTYARFSLFDANVTPGSDLDLYVFKGTTFVGGSGNGGSNEEVNLVNPAAGNDYIVYVHGFDAAPGGSNFTLFSWLLGTASSGNMTVTAPAAAQTGQAGTVHLAFSALSPATKYLGSVEYQGSPGLPDPTIVRVDTPN